ncbi:tyrosine-type recombinase/integrase [Planococcus antarcticus]|uniref:tyrosine-type recombinase/integrase n=1 Tax=Planococcus antarcticus TaxID=161360 RepID=UPI000A66EC18|nr:tyrosine-type recombinase/integrase [Planococcus antarcticus]
MDTKAFAEWLFAEGKADKTIQSYTTDVNGFQAFLTQQIGKDKYFNRSIFLVYIDRLVRSGYAVATINKKVNSLKVFNDFLLLKGLVTERYIHMKKDRIGTAVGSEDVVTVLLDEEVERLLFYVNTNERVSIRNKLIVYLLLYTGVRVTELVELRLSSIDFLTSHIVVVGKGGKRREIGLRSDVLQLVRLYIKKERSKSVFNHSDYLLVSQRGGKLHRDAVRHWLAKISEELKLKLHPHLFRHTFCTRLIQKGVDLTTVSRLAGHGSVNMTAKYYIQTSREEKMDAVNRL